MSVPNDGGPAFPVADFIHPSGQVEHGHTGMTLRDWFAGQFLTSKYSHHSLPENTAEYAYMIADAMLKQRIKPL